MKTNTKIQGIKSSLLFFYLLLAEIIVSLFLLAASPGNERENKVVITRGTKDVTLSKDTESSIHMLGSVLQDSVCYLSWLTNKESSDGYYVIERYKNSDSSQYIGIIPAKGGEKILYSFEDKNYPAWNCFYRVWFVGNDDTYFESEYIIPESVQEFVRQEN